MRTVVHSILRANRVRTGPYASPDSFGLTGAFHVIAPETGRTLCIISATGEDWDAIGLPGLPWEHVSVSVFRRSVCPSWPEMCYVKDLFWDEEETVLQFHPPKSVYVNDHPGVLHLWKPSYVVPLPPTICVGLGKDQQQLQPPAPEPGLEEPKDPGDAGAIDQGV